MLRSALQLLSFRRGLFMLIEGAISDRLPTNYVAAISASVNTIWIGIVAVLFVDAFQLSAAMIVSARFSLSETFLYPPTILLFSKQL